MAQSSAPQRTGSTEPATERTPLPILMDVDTGIDDAFALLFAVRSPDLDLRAVTCVGGNTGVDQVVANTRYVLDAAGAPDIPVGRGAAHPLLFDAPDSGAFHGADGLGGFSRPSDRRTSPLAAVDLLRHELHTAVANGEPVTLVATAPLTTIALLLRTYPDVAAGIERLVFMGGSATRGNMTPVAEHNVLFDPEATAAVLAASRELDIPVTMYGLDVFDEPQVPLSRADELSTRLDPACQLAGALLRFRARGADSAGIGDAGTLCALVAPDGLRTRRLPVAVDTGFGPGRGQTIVDRRPATVGRAVGDPFAHHWTEIDVALEVDAQAYADLWWRTVAG